MLPDLFVNDLYITDSLTQPTTLLHNDDITSDDVTGSVGDNLRNVATTYDDLNSKGNSL